MRHEHRDKVNPRARGLLEARTHDPFSVLGVHKHGSHYVVRIFDPQAERAWVHDDREWREMQPEGDGVFKLTSNAPMRAYRVRLAHARHVTERFDAYAFPPSIPDHDLYLSNEGRLLQSYRMLGAHARVHDGVRGYRFACWAPNAERVSVVGDFNSWDGRAHQMAVHGTSGVWELFVPSVPAGALYNHGGSVVLKTDPYAREYERRPVNASRTTPESTYRWNDNAWMQSRASFDWQHSAINIYEVHLGSWRRHPDGRFYSYAELAASLVPYVKEMGYTHIELLPVTEHPLDESWGYQSTGFFAPTSRYGNLDDFRAFVDACHQAEIGVILDWVPGHFPRDSWALAHFDASALYEHEDPRLGVHQDWGTHCRGIDRVAGRLTPGLSWRARLHDEVEHGLDERHLASFRSRSDPSTLPSFRAYVRPDVCL